MFAQSQNTSHCVTFLDLLRSGEELDCELIIGGDEMPATFVWDEDSQITAYGVERYRPIMEASFERCGDNCIEIHCDDWELGEEFCLAAAGFISSTEYEKVFGSDALGEEDV